MSKKDEKTNVMRILDQKKIEYKSYSYLQDRRCERDGSLPRLLMRIRGWCSRPL